MVFRRNTLKNTKTFKQINKTSSGSSNIKTLSTKQNIPTPQTSKHMSGSGSRSEEPKRQTYRTNSTKEWSLSSIFPEIVPPEAYADTGEIYDPSAGDAGGKFQPPDGGKYDAVSANADKVPWPDDYNPYGQNERTKDMQSKYSGTTNVAKHAENIGWGGIITGAISELVGNPHLFTPLNDPSHPRYVGKAVVAEEDQSTATPAIIPVVKDEVKLDPYPDMTQGAQAGGWSKTAKGEDVYAKKPEGSTLGSISDYVNNEQRSSFYNLPDNVSAEKHQAALDRQSMAKFENSIQKSYTTMLSGSGPGKRMNEENFLNLKSQINNSNISQGKKDDLISEYTNKIAKYQKTAGGYGTDTPWSFGNSQPKNPNKAERLQNKLDSGGQLSEKERNYLAVVTGKNKAPQYDSIGMGQVPDYAEMFTPGVTDKVLKKKEQPIWFDYQDLGY